jgi:hypothetical protein
MQLCMCSVARSLLKSLLSFWCETVTDVSVDYLVPGFIVGKKFQILY